MKRLWIIVIALGLAAPAAWAEEESDVARAGRLLLSADEAQSAEGEALIVKALAAGADPAILVRELARSVRTWADNDQRLVSLWIRQALGPDATVRRRAVRLITAMGEKAVMRLVLEVRDRQQERAQPPQVSATPPGSAQPNTPEPSNAERQTDTTSRPQPHVPQVYPVDVLKQQGLNRLAILDFLRRAANASQVRPSGDQFVVYADGVGHLRLAARLLAIASKTPAGQPEFPIPTPPTGTNPTETEPLGAKPTAPSPIRRPRSTRPPLPPAKAQTPSEGHDWLVHPLVVRVPRDPTLAKRIGAWAGLDINVIAPLLALRPKGQSDGETPTDAIVGAVKTVNAWFGLAPALPGARTSYGQRTRVSAHGEGRAFIGERIPYRRGLVQVKKTGGWRVDEDILRTGLRLTFKLSHTEAGLDLQINARLSEVSIPMATTRVRRTKGAPEIELDQPEWNHQSRADHVKIPATGGGVLLVMPDPAKAETGLVLVLIRVEPTLLPAQVAFPNRMNGVIEKRRGGN